MQTEQLAAGQIRPVTAEEVEQYKTDGMVHLKGILDADLVVRMEKVFMEVMDDESNGLASADFGELAKGLEAQGLEVLNESNSASQTPKAGTGTFKAGGFNCQNYPSLNDLGTTGPFGPIAAKLMGSERICFYGDQLFWKQPNSLQRTAFHQDATYFHHEGEQCCTFWMPMEKVDEENGMMGYAKGSHRGELYKPNLFVSQASFPGSEGKDLPDVEANEKEFNVVYCPAEPGDIIVHHVKTWHGSTGNTSQTRHRRAMTLRYLGDDVRYLERMGTPPDSPKSAQLKDGDPIECEEFPLMWTRKDGFVAKAQSV
ncbi:MAG: phytanoyl-CoA dioxygenase family protein [Pseudomonadota bacterium]